MGIKDRVGIKRTLDNTTAPGNEGAPAVDLGSGGVDPRTGKITARAVAPSIAAPSLEAKPVLRTKPAPPRNFYDCSRCPGYCCSYPRIEVKPSDVRRLAAYHGISVEKAERKFTRIYMDDGKPERILRHQKDTVYKTICRFFDTDLRRCTIYEGRPQVCREYPNGRHCGYYTFIKFERKHQDDDTFVPSA